MMTNKKTILLWSVVLAAVAVASCRQVKSGQKEQTPHPRIVSLAPNLTEIVFSLGMGDHLVGVTDHCNYPAQVKSKPRLGGLKTISLEAVIAANPDIVLATKDGNEQSLIDEMTRLHLKVLAYQPYDLDQVLETILSVGKELGVEDRGKKIVKELREKEKFVDQSVMNAKPVPAILAYQRQPLILSGPGTFADDLIKKAGGANLAGDAGTQYPRYSMEMIIEKSPQAIVDVSMGNESSAEKQAKDFWSQWPDLPAVKNNRVAVMDPDLITRPGPRLFDGLVELAQILHPECFGAKK
jgi:iron complex transport system substrate-binding protein